MSTRYYNNLKLLLMILTCIFIVNSAFVHANKLTNKTESVKKAVKSETLFTQINIQDNNNFSFEFNKQGVISDCSRRYPLFKTCMFVVNGSPVDLIVRVANQKVQFVEAKQIGYLLNKDIKIDSYHFDITNEVYPTSLYNGDIKNQEGVLCYETFCVNAEQ